ncbi:hypothetical protein M5K25_027111 [Dendrobium thyrsiflorum]|uniref:Uncharacterized protein n=1 Tax=Dendrobium thyrsiflorum TaxID=117978 RepID=A0ABD0TYX2_DENTH
MFCLRLDALLKARRFTQGLRFHARPDVLPQCLCTLASDTTSKLNVLGHDGDAPRMDGAEISILKKPDEIRLRGFLKSEHGMALKSQICLVILGKLTHQPLKRKFADQEFSGLLVLANLTTNPFESRSELVQERFLPYEHSELKYQTGIIQAAAFLALFAAGDLIFFGCLGFTGAAFFTDFASGAFFADFTVARGFFIFFLLTGTERVADFGLIPFTGVFGFLSLVTSLDFTSFAALASPFFPDSDNLKEAFTFKSFPLAAKFLS